MENGSKNRMQKIERKDGKYGLETNMTLKNRWDKSFMVSHIENENKLYFATEIW